MGERSNVTLRDDVLFILLSRTREGLTTTRLHLECPSLLWAIQGPRHVCFPNIVCLPANKARVQKTNREPLS